VRLTAPPQPPARKEGDASAAMGGLGAGTVIVTHCLPGRLEKAAEFGADVMLDASATAEAGRAAAVAAATRSRR